MPNRLARSLSPYLLQHRDNPVDWFEWGEEALAKARAEDKPIFLSIGYSACHWCHVMAHESFENEQIAAYLNEHFVNIKVDREERPDLDAVYMAATIAFSGHGGWPMTVFLTPGLEPFFAGTYFPPMPRWNSPGFPQLIRQIASAWRDTRSAIQRQADQLHLSIRRHVQRSAETGGRPPGQRAVEELIEHLHDSYDQTWGGFGDAPKFPDSQGMLVLLGAYAQAPGEARARAGLGMVEQTLLKMALGGIRDHLGGGFARYSTDEMWLVPHFEKMLYDNAMLLRAYLAAWKLTRLPFFEEVVRETLEWLLREMQGPEGGFYSAQDADSEGEEGRFYVWSEDEIRVLLGPAAEEFCEVYQVSREGNFEGHNILWLERRLIEWEAERPGIRQRLAAARATLKRHRDGRIWPGLDDKVLTEWNGLLLVGLADAAASFGDARYLEAARRLGAFLTGMWQGEGEQRRLMRVFRAGERRGAGNLADHTALAEGMAHLFCATGEARWLEAAEEAAQAVIARFADPAGGFWFTEEAPDLLVRGHNPHDNPYPSGQTMAVGALTLLARLTGSALYEEHAAGTLSAFRRDMERIPRGYSGLIGQLQQRLAEPVEVIVVGPEPQTLARTARQRFQPGRLVLAVDPASEEAGDLAARLPLLSGRGPLDGVAAAYVCRSGTCALPVTKL